MGKIMKQWKSDGEADKFLYKLIEQKKITRNTNPRTLTNDYPSIFGAFSENVVRNHLNIAKRATGLYREQLNCYLKLYSIFTSVNTFSPVGSEDDDEDHPPNDVAEEKDNVEEKTVASSSSSEIDVFMKTVPMVNKNYPVICRQYKCPITEYDKVVVSVALPGGAQDLKAELHDDGISFNVKYRWPKPMYDVTNLFKAQIESQELFISDPMIVSYKAGLAEIKKKSILLQTLQFKFFFPFWYKRRLLDGKNGQSNGKMVVKC